MDGIKTHTEKVTPERLSELAESKDTTVYEYTYDRPETTLDARTQITLFKAIVQMFDAACAADATACDEAIREKILKPSEDLRLFQRLYPKVFASCTVRARNAEMEERLDKTRKISMLMLAERLQGDGDEDEKAARAMCAGMRIAMRDSIEEDFKNSEIHQAPGEVASTMTPLDRRELGESTVKQGRKF